MKSCNKLTQSQSRVFHAKEKQTLVIKTPCCPHCTNINLKKLNNEKLPTNHWLRVSPDLNSPVMCPVLKETRCKKCNLFGHTLSHCVASTATSSTTTTKNKNTPTPPPPSSSSNRFSVLMNDGGDEMYSLNKNKTNRKILKKPLPTSSSFDFSKVHFPELPAKPSHTTTTTTHKKPVVQNWNDDDNISTTTSYLSVLEETILEEKGGVKKTKQTVPVVPVVAVPSVSLSIANKHKNYICWADCESSDDDCWDDYLGEDDPSCHHYKINNDDNDYDNNDW